jgi:UDP-2-acetamido-3-amino-2,3-dideoxy-glucuronate N-acetyltransferase
MPAPEKAEAQVVELDRSEPLKNECSHFLETVHTGLAPVTDGREGLRVLTVLDACQRSLNQDGGVVRLEPAAPPVEKDPGYFVHPTAIVDEGCAIGKGTRIWHFAHIIKGSRLGERCNLGQNVMVGPDVTIGNGVKIQNNVSVYTGVTLEDDVFCGPSMVFTNVYNPRAFIVRKDELRPTLIKKGASLGANSTIVCGNTVGEYAFVGAGAVVKSDVPAYAMVVGNPAVQKGWMCACGVRLFVDNGQGTCDACGKQYVLEGERLRQA